MAAFEYYMFDKRTKTIKVVDRDTWSKYFETSERILWVDRTEGSTVSTVFLGLDHGFGRGVPILFETMVFDGPLDGEEERYASWQDARDGHALMLARVIKEERDDAP